MEGLERVLNKLALASSDDALAEVLSVSLINTINQIASADPNVRASAAQILAHISKRVKPPATVRLPVRELIALLASPTANTAAKHMGTLYLDMGFARLTHVERKELLPLLTSSFATLPPTTKDCFLSLAVGVLAELPRQISDLGVFYTGLFPILANKQGADKIAFVQHLLDLFLFTPNPYAEGVVPGLSPSLVARWAKRYPNTPQGIENIGKHKLAVCAMLGCAELFSATEVLPHLLAAAGDQNQKVAAQAEWSTSRLVNLDLNDPLLVRSLYALFLGDTDPNIQPQEKRSPATYSLRVVVLAKLSQSTTAANTIPQCIQVAFEALFGQNTNAKMRELGLGFVAHIARSASNAPLAQMAPLLIQAVTKTLDQLDGLVTTDVFATWRQHPVLVSKVYSAIGLLTLRAPALMNTEVRFVRRLFQSLDIGTARGAAPSEDIVLHAQDALLNMTNAFKIARAEVRSEIMSLLLAVITSQGDQKSQAPHSPAARFAAIRWANELFEPQHEMARYVCVLAMEDTKQEVRKEAEKGLNLKKAADHPDFDKFVIFALHKQQETQSWLTSTTLLHLITFCHRCLEAKAVLQHSSASALVHAAATSEGINAYIQLLQNCLTLKGGSDALAEQALVQLSILLGASQTLCQRYNDVPDWLWTAVAHPSSSRVRTFASRCLRHLSKSFETAWAMQQLERVQQLANEEKNIGPRSGLFLALGALLVGAVSTADKQKKTQDGLVGECVRFLVSRLGQSSNIETIAVCEAIGSIGASEILPLLVETGTKEPSALQRIVELFSHVDAKIKETASFAAARIVSRNATSWEMAQGILSKLFSVLSGKDVELSFSVSRAICLIANTENFDWTGKVLDFALDACRTATSPTIQGGYCVCLMVLAGEVGKLSAETADSLVDTNTTDTNTNTNTEPLTFTFDDRDPSPQQDNTPQGKGGVALQERLPLLQQQFFATLAHPQDYIQEVASRGLTIIFERGNEELREQLAKQLVKAMTQTVSTPANAANLESNNEDDTNDTQENQKSDNAAPPSPSNQSSSAPSAVGSGAASYKEMCTLAIDMGKPELLYSLMELSKHNALWTSRTGAAFALTNIARKHIEPYLPTLIPKLFRFQFDPNPRVQASMRAVWSSLVPNTATAIQTFWTGVCEEVCNGLTSRLWRVRESSAFALADLVVGKTISQLEQFYEPFMRNVFRVLDDIKESVRKAAATALKSLNGLTLRLCDPATSSRTEVANTLALAIPLLLDHGLTNLSKEVQAMSVEQLQKITKQAGPAILPVSPKVVQVLLEYLSSSDSDILNYIQTRSEGMTAIKLEAARIAAITQLPLFDTCTRCLQFLPNSLSTEGQNGEGEADSEELVVCKDLIAAVCGVVKSGTGLMTRGAAAKWLQALASQRPQVAGHFHKRILKSLMGAIKTSDRSPALQNVCAVALGHVVRLAPSSAQGEIVQQLVQMYMEDTIVLPDEPPNAGDDSYYGGPRSVSGEALLEITRRSDALRTHLVAAICAIMLARHDTSPSVRRVWRAVWEEGAYGGALTSVVRLYAKEVLEGCIQCVSESSVWRLKTSAACVITEIAKNSAGESAVREHRDAILHGLARGLKGRTFEGKYLLLECVGAVATVLWGQSVEQSPEHVAKEAIMIVSAVATECGKRDLVYKRHALQCMAAVLAAYGLPLPDDKTEQVINLAEKATEELTVEDDQVDTSTMSLDERIKENKATTKQSEDWKLACSSACLCLSQIRASEAAAAQIHRRLVTRFCCLLTHAVPTVRIASLTSIGRLAERDSGAPLKTLFEHEFPSWQPVWAARQKLEEEAHERRETRRREWAEQSAARKAAFSQGEVERRKTFEGKCQGLKERQQNESLQQLEQAFADQESRLRAEFAASEEKIKEQEKQVEARDKLPDLEESKLGTIRVVAQALVACSKLANPLALRRQLTSTSLKLAQLMQTDNFRWVDSGTTALLAKRLKAIAHTDGDPTTIKSAQEAVALLDQGSA